MKKFSKLKLNKKTISSLNDVEMSMVKGGTNYCNSNYYYTCNPNNATCQAGCTQTCVGFASCEGGAECTPDTSGESALCDTANCGTTGSGGTGGGSGGDATFTSLAGKPCCGDTQGT